MPKRYPLARYLQIPEYQVQVQEVKNYISNYCMLLAFMSLGSKSTHFKKCIRMDESWRWYMQ